VADVSLLGVIRDTKNKVLDTISQQRRVHLRVTTTWNPVHL